MQPMQYASINIYENTNTGLNYQSIKEQYIDQFNYMNAMGFTDYHKIIIALYVCEGDRQAAINYYLSQKNIVFTNNKITIIEFMIE